MSTTTTHNVDCSCSDCTPSTIAIPVLSPITTSIDSEYYLPPKPPCNTYGKSRQQLDAERER